MNFHLREQWRELKRGRPGHRFQDRYARSREEAQQCGAGQRIAMLVAAIVCLAIGVVLVVFPGPAVPFFFLAGGLLAAESRPIARFMDWAEVHCRKLAAWGKHHWRRLPIAARAAVVIFGACLSAGMTFLTYRFLRG